MCEIIHFACKITHGVWNYTFCANYRMCMKSTLLIALTFCNRNTPHTVSGVFDKFKVWAHTAVTTIVISQTIQIGHCCTMSTMHNVHKCSQCPQCAMCDMCTFVPFAPCSVLYMLPTASLNCTTPLLYVVHMFPIKLNAIKEFDDCH